tara:strand:- start:60 stop:647 length:588 start_codon:yes stop_codon:yes gene_type:complete
MKPYKLVREDIIKNLIEFLDTVQYDAITHENERDAMHKVNFCNWMIQELTENLINVNIKTIKPKDNKKTDSSERDKIIDEHFHDWKLPDMSDEEFEKLVGQFDAFLRGWEKEYNKKNPEEPVQERDYKPRLDDVVEYCSLEEIEEMLKDDPELSDAERFELYYEERERRKDQGFSLDEMLKDIGIEPHKPNGKKN